MACSESEQGGCPLFIAVNLEDIFNHATAATTRANGSGSEFTCPHGGSATVTGSSTISGMMQISDEMVVFHNCEYPLVEGTYVLDGTLRGHNTYYLYGGKPYCMLCELTSDALHIGGTEPHCNNQHLDMTCEIAFTVTDEGPFTGRTGTFAGELCSFKID